jgi:RND family efflux transporter MFP subunit
MTPLTPRRVTRDFRGLLAVAIAGGLAAVGCGQPSVEQVDTTTAVPVSVEAARVEPLTTEVSVSGTIAPAPGADWVITAPVQGTIAELPKAEGDVVHEGDLLVRFDIPSLPADAAARKADIAQAQVKAETARAEVARLTPLVAQGIAAQRELQEAKATEAEAEATLSQAQSGSTAAIAMADRMVVRARFNGVVAKRWHNPGDIVDASVSDPILRVVNPAALQAIAAVPIADLPRVEVGRTARVTGPAGGDGEAAAVLSKPAQVEAGSPTADVRLRFAAPTHLPINATVHVDILADERAHALTVPAAAVVRDGDDTFVMVAGADNKAHKHAVKTGLMSRQRVEILSGLAAGDLTIVIGQDGLPDNAAIQIVK